MNGRAIPDDLWPLLDAVCEGELTPEQWSKLELCLEQSPDAQRILMDHIWLCTQVNAWSKGERWAMAGLARVAGTLRTGSDSAVEPPVSGGAGVATPHRLIDSRPPNDALPLVSAPSWSFTVPLGGVLFAYVLAALLLGAGVLTAFLAFGVSGDRDAAADAQSFAKPLPGTDARQAPIVGYVTNVPTCKWLDSGTAVALASPVLLGRTFALASGSLEITYNTGERIILHGPATYQTRWPKGGFLSQGRLTALAIAARAAGGAGQPEGAPTPGSTRDYAADPVGNFLVPRSPFFIRTPSTLAISRGAEFEVSVDGTGATNTRLALGVLEAWYPRGGKPNDVISSSARRAWAWVAFTRKHDVRVMYGTGTPSDLMRTVFANTPGSSWPAGPAGGGSLRIWGLESQQPCATAGTLPRGHHERTTD